MKESAKVLQRFESSGKHEKTKNYSSELAESNFAGVRIKEHIQNIT